MSVVVVVDVRTSQEEVRGGLDAMVRALRDVDPLDSRLSFRELLLLNTTNTSASHRQHHHHRTTLELDT